MLYHAILQLKNAIQPTKREYKGGRMTRKQNEYVNKMAGSQTRKTKPQLAFNKRNTIDRRNELKKLINS